MEIDDYKEFKVHYKYENIDFVHDDKNFYWEVKKAIETAKREGFWRLYFNKDRKVHFVPFEKVVIELEEINDSSISN